MRTIALTDGAFKQIQELKHLTEDKSEAEVIQKALATYEALSHQIREGGEIFIHKADGSEMRVPLF